MDKFITVGIFLEFFVGLNGCVYITVSPLPADILEVNWNCQQPIETISVFGRDPKEFLSQKPLIQFSIANHPEGYYKTHVTFNPEPFPGGWSRNSEELREAKSQCLYWTMAHYQKRLVHYDCYRINPAWMFENKEHLKNLSLPFMFFPGTHNSGTDAMKILRKRTVSHLDNFVLTQDQKVWNQLVYGIRFFDFRIGFYPFGIDPKRRFWINHDMLRVQPLLPILKDIVEFLKSSPDEIIILDFHRFPAGFRTKNAPAIHRELIQLLNSELKDLVIPRPVSQSKLKLEDIWKTDRRIVVSYSEENFTWETPWLWTSVSQRWGNKQTPEALEKFLDNTFRDVAPGKLWAAMAELTPTPLDFLGRGSLRSMADRVNRLLNVWFAQRQNWTSRANIVAVDFFRGTDLINLAIRENVRRGKENLSLESHDKSR